MEAGIDWWQGGKQAGAGTAAWMVYVAVAMDLLGDGLLIGAESAVSTNLALVLALGQVFIYFAVAVVLVSVVITSSIGKLFKIAIFLVFNT